MRPTKNKWAMDLAKVTAKRATCLRREVGCVLLDARGHVLSTGYNGVASGMPHCNEHKNCATIAGKLIYPNACLGANSPSGTNLDCCQAIHAEQNALLQCRDVYSIHACYTTSSPCMTCIKLLLNTSCEIIYFNELYTDKTPLSLWDDAGRKWIQL